MSSTDSTRFDTTNPNIVTELFDDEMVVVDFDTGRYFSLDVVGAEIFTLLAAHHSVAEVATVLTGAFTGTMGDIAPVVEGFAAELVEAQLLAAGSASTPTGPAVLSRVLEKGPMPAPSLTAYTDMQDLLMLDPIHDVAETGWPARPDES